VLLARIVGEVKAVDDISFAIAAGETLGLVGESSCVKATTSRLTLNLEQTTGGQVLLQDTPIHDLHGGALRGYRTRMRAVFQGPWSSLNLPNGCRFHARCLYVMPRCAREEPILRETVPGHRVACHLHAAA
jgi:ABC-type glutathione transport system ATPase component